MIESKLNVIVIEDEELSRKRVLRLLRDESRVKVIGQFESLEQMKDQSLFLSANILILDINLPGKNGIEIAEIADKNQVVIFTTAYSRFAVEAFNVRAIDYLVKPISKQRLKKAINSAISKLIVDNFYAKNKEPQFIKIKYAGRIIRLNHDDIFCIRSDNNHVKVYTFDKEYLLKRSLSSTLNQLDFILFVRCHRTCIVNLEKIRKIIPAGSTKNALLDNNLEIPLSRKFIKRYKAQLSIYL